MPRRILLSSCVAILSLALPALPARSRSYDTCFPNIDAIENCVNGRFAQYWQESGGLMVFGYPLTPVFDAATRDGHVMAQMVERNRLEYHPEKQPPYDILLGRLGEDALAARGRDWRSEPPGAPQTGCWFARETRHTVCDQEPGRGFLTYFRTHGLELNDPELSQRESLALFGLPLTEAALETNAAGDTVLTQWFERARLEYHPHNPSQYRVLLGLLGSETWDKTLRPAPALHPVPPALAEPLPPQLQPPAEPQPRRTSTPSRPPAQSTPTDEPPTRTPTQAPSIDPTPTTRPTIVEPRPTNVPEPTDDPAAKRRLFEIVDAYHQQAGCSAYKWDERLEKAAQAHVDDIAEHKRIDHVGTDGATLRMRLDRVGYPYNRASEGIAVYRVPEVVADYWMDEPEDGPHRRNITNCQYTDAGVGLAYDDRGRRWWVVDFASRRTGY